MIPIHLYYAAKPLIPRRVQIELRRALAARKRVRCSDRWPISPLSMEKPVGWKGWPDGKQFALVVIHDVDTILGLSNCLKLADVDRGAGVRSSFNFVPEGYGVPSWYRSRLRDMGFEVGVHGLKHDGKLFLSRAGFDKGRPLVNEYLRSWGSVGFVPPSMIGNLKWMPELDIEWGCSTFDTDPFEPRAGDMHTIFPFIVSDAVTGRSYVEIPYTLSQDHGLFVILQEKDNRIWREKVDWIAGKGGVVMVNAHPDYMDFNGAAPALEQYPVANYGGLLEYIKDKYAGRFWNPLPREMADFWLRERAALDGPQRLVPAAAGPTAAGAAKPRPATAPAKIWIDLDNTPHVPFFIPIIRELERRGHKVVLTARDAFQVCELADKMGLKYIQIGRHYGKNPVKKVLGLFRRSKQLLPFLKREKPDLALSHGARSQIFLSNLHRIPTVLIADYEHSQTLPMARPRWLILPESILGRPSVVEPARIRYYRGIKEDVYVPTFRPAAGLLDELGLGRDELIVTVRPPADEAHYYKPESTTLFLALMDRLVRTPDVRAVLLPRNKMQEKRLEETHPEWFKDGKTIVPGRAVDGLDLIWLSDLVVSGGGTMNREAAALGVPVYSIFRGTIGAVDEMLEKEGRLILIRSEEEVWSRIPFTRRDKSSRPDPSPRPALDDIVGHVEMILARRGKN